MREFSRRVLHPNDLFALSFVHHAQICPTRACVAYTTSRIDHECDREHFDITIQDIETKKARTLSFSGKVTFLRWSPDGRVLAFVGADGDSSRLYVTNANLDDVCPLTPSGCHVQGAFSWAPDSSAISYSRIKSSKPGRLHRITTKVFRSEGLGFIDDFTSSIEIVDVRTGAIDALQTSTRIAMNPAYSPCGRRILYMASDAVAAYSVSSLRGVKLCTFDLTNESIQEVAGEGWSLLWAAWSPCGQRVVVAGAFESRLTIPTNGIWVMNRDGSDPQCRTTGTVGNVGLRVHHDMPTWDAQGNVFSVPDANYAYVTVTVRGCAEIWKVTLRGPIQCDRVVQGQRSCLIMDACERASIILFCASDLHKAWELHQCSMNGEHEQRLTFLNDRVLQTWPSLSVEHVEFVSADGLNLEGWHLARADRQGAQPTVMFIHGGPFIATGNAFRFDFQLLAANGYAVLFANFRGSAGYGEPFARAIMGDWGDRGFPDHMAAVDAAIGRGLSCADRLGVWGASHGGFATCWVVGHTRRFRAAVAESSSTNLSTMYYLSDAPQLFEYDLGGRPDEIPDVYRSRSPLTYAYRCSTPTLMLHGEEDLRCPIAEAEQFYRALYDAGCVTEFVRIPGMNHMGDSTGPLSSRLAQNEALLDWFERFL